MSPKQINPSELVPFRDERGRKIFVKHTVKIPVPTTRMEDESESDGEATSKPEPIELGVLQLGQVHESNLLAPKKRPAKKVTETTTNEPAPKKRKTSKTPRQRPSASPVTLAIKAAADTIKRLQALSPSWPALSQIPTKYSIKDVRLPSKRPNLPTTETRVEVIKGDTFDEAMKVYTQDPTVCVLNMANGENPGAGDNWKSGNLAQEEELFRRSSLSLSLSKGLYPLGPTEAIYSHPVLIFRSNINSGYQLLEGFDSDPTKLPLVGVVSMAALVNPARTNDGTKYASKGDRDLMKTKMNMILRIPAMNQCTSLVLGAFGCGVFGNPSEEVANCWKECLQESRYLNRFRKVIFAVWDPRGDGNHPIFKKVLDGVVVGMEEK